MQPNWSWTKNSIKSLKINTNLLFSIINSYQTLLNVFLCRYCKFDLWVELFIYLKWIFSMGKEIFIVTPFFRCAFIEHTLRSSKGIFKKLWYILTFFRFKFDSLDDFFFLFWWHWHLAPMDVAWWIVIAVVEQHWFIF